jgi:hypothetical protein
MVCDATAEMTIAIDAQTVVVTVNRIGGATSA